MFVRCLGMLLAVFTLVLAPTVEAQTVQQLQNSSGYTRYQAANGQWVQANVQLQGTQGYYQTPGGTGQLYNVQYNPFPTGVTVSGNWNFGGQSGTFAWHVGYNFSFAGEWWYQPNQRWPWSGSLTPANNNPNCGYPGGPACPQNCGYPGGPACP